jgi:hypothetical protein
MSELKNINLHHLNKSKCDAIVDWQPTNSIYIEFMQIIWGKTIEPNVQIQFQVFLLNKKIG